jgi:hypothetical protein
VPAGLGRLTAPLTAFADFLRIDADLIAVAAGRNTGTGPEGLSKKELSRLISTLPEAEKTSFLVRLAEGEEALLRPELLRRLRGVGRATSAEPRTFAELHAAAERRAEERSRKAAARAARGTRRRNRKGQIF